MKEIKLTSGKVTLVDDEDYGWLSEYRWWLNSGYAMRNRIEKGVSKTIHMSRVIMNAPDDMFVDHINRNTLDNRRENLRICTKRENCANRGVNRNNTSGVKGVSWDTESNKWKAQLRHNYKLINLGRFTNISDASEAYANGAKKYFGEFAHIERE